MMKIGDIVRVAGEWPALVIAVAYRDGENMPTEVRVRFLKKAKTRWVLAKLAEVLSESR